MAATATAAPLAPDLPAPPLVPVARLLMSTSDQNTKGSSGKAEAVRSVLPLINCPSCGVPVKRFVSKTKKNPGRAFYRCVRGNDCKFWRWENDYVRLLSEGDSLGEADSSAHLTPVQMEHSPIDAAFQKLQELVELEAAALKKVVGDNLCPCDCSTGIYMNRVLLDVEAIATRLEQLWMDTIDAAAHVHNSANAVVSCPVPAYAAVEMDPSLDADPDDLIPDYDSLLECMSGDFFDGNSDGNDSYPSVESDRSGHFNYM